MLYFKQAAKTEGGTEMASTAYESTVNTESVSCWQGGDALHTAIVEHHEQGPQWQ